MIEFAPTRCILFTRHATFTGHFPWPTPTLSVYAEGQRRTFRLRTWLGASALYVEERP